MISEKDLGKVLDKQDQWYTLHFDELVSKYAGKAIAMVDEKVVVVAETEREADQMAKRLHPGSFPLVVTVPLPEELVCLI